MTQRCLILLWMWHATGCLVSNDVLETWNGAPQAPATAQNASPATATTPEQGVATPSAGSGAIETGTPLVTGQVAGSGTPAAVATGSSAAGSSAAGSSAAGSSSAGAGAAGSGGASAAPVGGAAAPVAGSSAAGAAAGSGGPALQPGALQCPKEVCAPLPAPPAGAPASFKIENCCAESGDCGTSLNGAACNATADSVPGCPPLSAMGFMVPSCCTPMGRCGINGASFMMGCVSLEDVAAQAGLFITVPAPKACTPAM